jgi:hypothetical protein
MGGGLLNIRTVGYSDINNLTGFFSKKR